MPKDQTSEHKSCKDSHCCLYNIVCSLELEIQQRDNFLADFQRFLSNRLGDSFLTFYHEFIDSYSWDSIGINLSEHSYESVTVEKSSSLNYWSRVNNILNPAMVHSCEDKEVSDIESLHDVSELEQLEQKYINYSPYSSNNCSDDESVLDDYYGNNKHYDSD
ncbi:2054_t:CDS:1 [Racocetra persica]|uniref:2054_t:CDS:1 n=1 Tax=Racocetra persica TaxID=160502 RepID=A0ACA9K7X1_9GLOM|nr:2054_t:CDS:1 [Racocetra persica]